MNLPTWMNEHHSEGFAVTDEGEEALTFTRAEFDAWVAEHDARMRSREPSDAQVEAAFDVIRMHRGGTGLMAVVRDALRAALIAAMKVS